MGSIPKQMMQSVPGNSEHLASISSLKYSSSEPQEFNRREATHKLSVSGMLGTLADVDALLAYGSAVLIEEMILRFPNRAADHGTWMRSMMKLGQMLSRLGLVDSPFRSPDFDRLWQMAYNTDKRFGLFNGHVREFDAVLPRCWDLAQMYFGIRGLVRRFGADGMLVRVQVSHWMIFHPSRYHLSQRSMSA